MDARKRLQQFTDALAAALRNLLRKLLGADKRPAPAPVPVRK